MKYLIIFVVLVALINVYFVIANYFNIVDKPNKRSSHESAILRGGGIIFYFGVLVFFILSGGQCPYFILGLSFIAFISFLDDILTLSNKLRLVVHLVSVSLMLYQLEVFDINYLYIFTLIVLCIGVINAYNFMDGINGMTGFYSLSVIIGLWLINNFHVNFISNDLIYYSFISVIVFSIYNFRTKAKCFAGDIGSISMAFILLYMIGKLIIVDTSFSIILILAVYGVDSILTIIHRLILKENIFKAHRIHLYQILSNEAKISHLIVSSLYASIQLGINLVLFIILRFDCSNIFSLIIVIMIFIILTIAYILIKRKYFYLHY